MLAGASFSLVLTAIVFAATAAAAQPAPEKRVALVIGIEDYAAARRLANPVRDARTVEAALRRLGFKVLVETDRTRRRLVAAVEDFAEEHKGADLALVFFAGHGVQVGGRNFLLPTDVKAASAADLEASALALDQLFERLATVAPRRIVLLDACRDNPFSHTGPAAGRGYVVAPDGAGPAAPLMPGLARIGRADGTLFAFATAPGATASDGEGQNSPFSEALSAYLGKPGLELGSIMKLVQMEVYERTRGRQLPYLEDALPGLIFIDTRGEPLPERDRLLLAMARIDQDTRAQVERIAGKTELPLAPLYGALLAGDAAGADYETRERRLVRAAENFIEARAELQTLASSDPEITRLRAKAEGDLSLGAFDESRAALSRAIDIDRSSGDRLAGRLRQRNLSEAASLAVRAGVARTRLEYRAAAADFKAAADLVERWDRPRAWSYRMNQGVNLRLQGEEFGENAALEEAIRIYRSVFDLAPRTERPAAWAATQIELGNGLLALGSRDSGTTRLEQAAAAYRTALPLYSRQQAPVEWARTQGNLGTALHNIGARDSSTVRLEEAVSAFRAALANLRERDPLLWAVFQNNLGNTLWILGARERGTARLEEAVLAFRESLSERTRERAPLDWAITQGNLGNVLSSLGERESGTARLEQSIAARRAALLEATRERAPLLWATTHNNLGYTLVTLAERESGTARLMEAVAAFRTSLLERTRERVPLQWARGQNNLGWALTMIGERDGSAAPLAEAAAALQAALLERTRERVPLDWAETMRNKAMLERVLAQRSPAREEHLRRARKLAEDARAVYRSAKASKLLADVEQLLDRINAELAKTRR